MTETTETVHELAEVRTAHAERYLGQMCKHFAHKRPVEYTERRSGRIAFGIGTCRLTADAETLTLDIEGAPGDMDQLRNVVARHLVRFAFREELAIDWHPK